MPAMKITKKFDRAFQWAGEKMGSSEARTSQSDEFKSLEAEMSLRIAGAERMHKSTNAYVKWASQRDDLLGDKERALPNGHVGRSMVCHGEDFESDSDFGNSLIAVGRANERLASMQEQYSAEVASTWLESLNRNLAMMRDYQNARKKLESRRLAYDSAAAKAQRSKRDDYRLDEEVRTSRAKYDEASDDVLRRMQDIKEAETDSLRELTAFLDAQLDFHDRCAEELRRARGDLDGIGVVPRGGSYGYGASPPRPAYTASPRTRSRKSSYGERAPREERIPRDIYEEYEPEPEPRLASRASVRRPPPEVPAPRPRAPSRAASTASSVAPSYASSYTSSRAAPGGPTGAERQNQQVASNVANIRSQLRPVGRGSTPRDDVFGDYEDASSDSSGGGSPRWGGQRSASPATSVSEWSSRGSGGGSFRKAPPPPPPSRAKKPAPPVPPKREVYI